MKKSVVIIIALIYVASVALVSFFGLQFKVFEEVVPVESVEILNEGLEYSDSQGKYIVIKPDANGVYNFKIEYRVYPDEATNQEVDFAYEEREGVTVDKELGTVTFERPNMIKVRVIAKDGSNAEDTILIVAN